jgi:diguanylate cyclase (GGDEF)-like protein
MAVDDQPLWIERWLCGACRRWHLRFAPPLEARFERDTGAERGRSLALLTLIGALAYLGWDLSGFTSGITAPARLVHALLVLPPALAGVVLFRRGLGPWRREALAALLVVISASGLTGLYATGAWDGAGTANTGVILTMLIGALVLPLRVPLAIVTTVTILGVQYAGLLLGPALRPGDAAQYLQTAAVAALVALLANWRHERDQRRGYLLALQERLHREALSADNRALDDLARRDPLTGLPNRRAFDAWLQGPMPALAEPRGVSLIAIDIDHFKPFNDHYGHPAGDLCLRQVAACLREHVRDHTELVARVGGEEFAVLLPATSAGDALDLAERLRAAVEAMAMQHAAPGVNGRVTISAGVAAAAQLSGFGTQALILRADAALYAAKQAGRNQVRAAAAEAALLPAV